MKHILVIADPIDNEQVAFQKAKSLAKLTVATVHVVAFCHEGMGFDDEEADFRDRVRNLVVHHTEQWWENFLQSQAATEGVSYVVVWEKYIHNWIIEHCQTTHYDLIVKTGHRSETPFYTPTDWHLFRESPVPIYSVCPEPHKTKRIVLAALDLMSKREEKQRLNERVLEAAFQLSVQTNATLHCCHAIDIPVLVRDMELIDVAARIQREEKIVRERAKRWLELYEIDNRHLHVNQGVPWQVLTSLSRKLKAECIVIGSMGRKGIPGKLIGNTAEKVIQYARSDLLVLGH